MSEQTHEDYDPELDDPEDNTTGYEVPDDSELEGQDG